MNKIINFHRVVDPLWLETTLNIIKSKYRIIEYSELKSYFYGNLDLKKSCHITFDDGDKTFIEVVYPILEKLQIPTTIFISPFICKSQTNFWFQEIEGYDAVKMKKIVSNNLNIKSEYLIKYSLPAILKNLPIDKIWQIIRDYKELYKPEIKESYNLNVDDLLRIDKNDLVTIGSHTNMHPILANEDDEKSKLEISESILDLQDLLGHEIECFSYPNGVPEMDFGKREINELLQNNCKISFSTESTNFSKLNNPLSIPRHSLTKGGPFFIKGKLSIGSYWEKIKHIISKTESSERLEFKTFLSSNYKKN